MTHRTPIEPHILNAYIDGDLTKSERLQVEEAAASNESVRQELLELQAVKLMLGSLPAFAPSRSFQLGDEYAASNQRPAGRVLRLLPALRSLSVAAALVFMIVAGALFLDINGESAGDAGQTLTQQNVLMGVTETEPDSSEESGDAGSASHEADSPLSERGDTASANEDPVESLPAAAPESSEDVGAIAAIDSEAETGVQDRTTWFVTAGVLAALTVVFGGSWYLLGSRQS